MTSLNSCEELTLNPVMPEPAFNHGQLTSVQEDYESDSSSCLSGSGESESLLSGRDAHRHPPRDRFKAVYLIFYILGVGTLLPWNMFITAKDYFSFQLRNTSAPAEYYDDKDLQTHLQISYESAVAMCSMIPNIIMQVLNASLTGRVSMRKRLIGSMVVMLVMFSVTLVFTKLSVSTWQTAFFSATLVCVVIMCGASALLQSSLFGLVGRFPQAYTQAIMGGMGLGGVFAALADIITKSFGEGVVASAFWFFLSADIVVLIALISYLCLYKLEYAKHHHRAYQKILLESRDAPQSSYFSDHFSLIRQLATYESSVLIIFLVTLMVFPATTANVQSVNKDNGSIWTGKFWLPLYCFLLFNVGDLTGRTLAGWVNIPRPKLLIPLLSWLRIIFIPLFIMCNVQPRSGTIPVVFNHDAYPVVIMVLFAISNGYLSTQALMIAPTLVERNKVELAGSLMSIAMTIGLAIGSGLSYLLVIAVKSW